MCLSLDRAHQRPLSFSRRKIYIFCFTLHIFREIFSDGNVAPSEKRREPLQSSGERRHCDSSHLIMSFRSTDRGFKQHGDAKKKRERSDVTLRDARKSAMVSDSRKRTKTTQSNQAEAQLEENNLATYKGWVYSNEPTLQGQGASMLRKLSGMPANHCQLYSEDLYKRLLGLIAHPDSCPALQVDCVWVLTNLCSGPSAVVHHLAAMGVIQQFVALLSAARIDTVLPAVWGLGNIAGESDADLQEHVLKCRVLSNLVEVAQKYDGWDVQPAPATGVTRDELLACLVWALSNMGLFRPLLVSAVYLQQWLCVVVNLLSRNTGNVDLRRTGCLALAQITAQIQKAGTTKDLDLVVRTGAVRPLIWCASSDLVGTDTTLHAVRALNNIVAGTGAQTQAVLDNGGMGVLRTLAGHTSAEVRREACWAMSNVAAGTSVQIQAMIECGALGVLVDAISNENETNYVRREAVWALRNIVVAGTRAQRQVSVSNGVVAAMTVMLDCKDNDVIGIAVECLLSLCTTGADDWSSEDVAAGGVHESIHRSRGADMLEELQNGDDELPHSLDSNITALVECLRTAAREAQSEPMDVAQESTFCTV